VSALTHEEYRALLVSKGLRYGVRCRLMGAMDEGAEFMVIGAAESPWVFCLVLRGDYNNFAEGCIEKVHSGLEPIP
jgi:hypothetical protein